METTTIDGLCNWCRGPREAHPVGPCRLHELAPDLLAALERCADFIMLWRDAIDGVQLSREDFVANCGVKEARALLARVRGEAAPQ